MKRRLLTVCTVAAALSMAVTGCGPDTGAPRAAAAPGVPGGQQGEITDHDRARIRHAEQLVVQECMRRQGFRYWVAAVPSAEESRGGGYVLDAPEWAAEHGYGSRLESRALAARTSDPNLGHREKLSKARLRQYLAALVGPPGTPEMSVEIPGGGTISKAVGGCEAKAEERLYGDRENWFRASRVAGNLTPLYVPDLLRDKRFVAALAKWSRCMRDRNRPYPDPQAARAAVPGLTEGLAEKQAFAVEVRLAVDEATCARDTGFAVAARALENEYRDGLRDRYGEELDTRDRMERAALARAEQITGSRP